MMSSVQLNAAIVPQRRCSQNNTFSESALFREKFKHYNKTTKTSNKKETSKRKRPKDEEDGIATLCKRKLTYTSKTLAPPQDIENVFKANEDSLFGSPDDEPGDRSTDNGRCSESNGLDINTILEDLNLPDSATCKDPKSGLEIAVNESRTDDGDCTCSSLCTCETPPPNKKYSVKPRLSPSPKTDVRKEAEDVQRHVDAPAINLEDEFVIHQINKNNYLEDRRILKNYTESMAECLRPKKNSNVECTKSEKKPVAKEYFIEEVNGESSLVFGKPRGCSWWPGIIVGKEYARQRAALENCCWIKWFGDDSISEALLDQLEPFCTFSTKYDPDCTKIKYKKGIKKALEVAAKYYEVDDMFDRKWKNEQEKMQALVKWGMTKFSIFGKRSASENSSNVDSPQKHVSDTDWQKSCAEPFRGIKYQNTEPVRISLKGNDDADSSNSNDRKNEKEVDDVQQTIESPCTTQSNATGDGTKMGSKNKNVEKKNIGENRGKHGDENLENTIVLSSVTGTAESPSQTEKFDGEEHYKENSLQGECETILSPLGDGKEGSLILGKLKGFDWWPGTLLSHEDARRRKPLSNHCWIRWFGDSKISEVRKAFISPMSCFSKFFRPKKMKGLYKQSIKEILMEAARRCNMSRMFEIEAEEEKINALVEWGLNNFTCDVVKKLDFGTFVLEHTNNKCKGHSKDDKKDNQLKNIPSEENAESGSDCSTIHEVAPSENNTRKRDKTRFGNPVDKPTLSSAVKKLFDDVADGKRNIEELCLACGDTDVKSPHPLFEGGFCDECHGLFLETAYLIDEDGYQMFCTICNDGTEVIMCDSSGCFRCYCSVCIDMFCGIGKTDEIQSKETWTCFLCSGNRARLLKSRVDWQERMKDLFSTEDEDEFPPLSFAAPVPIAERKPIRILALFDGIASGLVAIRELGLDVEFYAASEIDEQAIAVSHVRHKGIIHYLGDIRQITEKDIAKLGPFDLVIGGSPCNDLSIANPGRKGIYEGTGRLFFEFFRLLMYARPSQGSGRPFFWLFENVVGMRHEDRKTISRFLQCNPCMIDAKEVSAMHRARYFWGNVPGMSRAIYPNPGDRLTLDKCLEPNSGRKARFEKVRTITTRGNSLKQTKEMLLPITMDIGSKTQEDGLWCTEIERLFGFPDHYTDVANMGRTHRQKLLGSAWSVPVIKHLLSPLRDYFKTGSAS